MKPGNQRSGARERAWAWVPTLYFASGLPYAAVATVATVMYKNLGVPNDLNARYTSDLLWPWVLKPLWSPLVEVLASQRRWIVLTQGLIAAALLGVSLSVPQQSFLVPSLAFFWLAAAASATHDIAADGFYMASMPPEDQAWFVGIRSAFYRVATIAASGGIVWLAGQLVAKNASPAQFAPVWGWLLGGLAALFLGLAAYHSVVLPTPPRTVRAARSAADIVSQFDGTFVSFFQKRGIWPALVYLLVYRVSEAPLGKLKAPFLLDPREDGGLGLGNQQLGLIDGTIGVVLLTLGGIVGGVLLSRDGLRRWIFPMALAINLPNGLYAWLAIAQPESLWAVGAVVGFEQLMYGFGFAAYMLYMLELSRGEHQTAHYALCTGFMALGVLIPGRYAGDVQREVGYADFFLLVFALATLSLLVTAMAPLRDDGATDQAIDHTPKEAP